MRLISKTLSVFTNKVIKVKGTHCRNFAKALNQEYVAPSQETLTGRILLYLNIDKEKNLNPSTNIPEMLTTLRRDVKSLQKFNTHEIINVSNCLTEQDMTRRELVALIRHLDMEYCSRLSELSSTDILKLLNVYMLIIPNRITDFKFYQRSVKVLFDSRGDLHKKDLLQLIFYIGLNKKKIETQTMLRECMRMMDSTFINNLTIEELCIICNSSFKTSTKIINKLLLQKINNYINDNLFIMKDCALFVTLLKTLRHNRQQNDDLLSTITCATIFNKTFNFYSFSMICHIMALYADYFYYEEKLFKIFTKICLKQLSESSFISKKTYLTEQPRGKDIKRFLWILSMFSELKLVDKCDVQNVIMPKLIERIEAKEFENDIDSLIDIALYLWILNYRPYELVPYIFTEYKTRLSVTGPKSNLRLNLLLYSIFTEDPNLFKKISVKLVNIPNDVFSTYQLQKRPLIQRLLNTLKANKQKFNMDRFELTQEIPHLNIIGITGYKNEKNKAVYIELLDDYTSIKNVEDDVPVGLMALKLRLLDHSEEGLLTVSQKEIEDMTEAELVEYLLDEIRLIC